MSTPTTSNSEPRPPQQQQQQPQQGGGVDAPMERIKYYVRMLRINPEREWTDLEGSDTSALGAARRYLESERPRAQQPPLDPRRDFLWNGTGDGELGRGGVEDVGRGDVEDRGRGGFGNLGRGELPVQQTQQQQPFPADTWTYAQHRVEDLSLEYIAVTPPPPGSQEWRPIEWLQLQGSQDSRKAALDFMVPFGIFPEATEPFWSRDEDTGEWYIGEGDWQSWEAVKNGTELQRRVWNEQHGFWSMCVRCWVMKLPCDHGYPCKGCTDAGAQCKHVCHMADEKCKLGVDCVITHWYQVDFLDKVVDMSSEEMLAIEWKFPLKEGEDWAMGVEMGTVKSMNEVGDVVAFGKGNMPLPGMARPKDYTNPNGWSGQYGRPWIYRTFYPAFWNGDLKERVLAYWDAQVRTLLR
ncbi:hypothetical protein LTR27_003487 [Elasticomyces elasticus]|nr:hypothetical protein LTR27_003487 [Elasticomyces elasticus]